MRIIRDFSAAVAVALAMLLPFIKACPPPALVRRQAGEAFILGDDGPADHPTLGYTMNHMALVVNDMEAMRDFYGKILGMRHIFTYHATPRFDIVYMGYSHGGKNGTGYQTGEGLYREKSNIKGLLEFVGPPTVNQSSSVPATTKMLNTFSHVGLVVPDTKGVEERLKNFDVRILKPVGVMPVPGSETAELLEGAFGLASLTIAEQQDALAAWVPLGFERFLIVADPDGNVLEIQDQVGRSAGRSLLAEISERSFYFFVMQGIFQSRKVSLLHE